MTYDEWQLTVPSEITDDTLWRVEAYRLGLFAADIAWKDVTKLGGDRRTRAIADQLYRAVSSISSNVGEGYSRGTGRDRARFYEYALGSACETRDWYYKARNVLGTRATNHRLPLIAQITRLMLVMVSRERKTNRKIID